MPGRSTGQHMLPATSPQNKRQQRPPSQTKNPSCRHSVAACVSDHSRGQALAPATPPSPNGNNTPPQKQKTLVLPLHRRLRLSDRSTERVNMNPATSSSKQTAVNAPPQEPKTPSCPKLCSARHACLDHSRGTMPRSRNNIRNQTATAPPSKPKTARTPSLCGGMRVMTNPERVKDPPDIGATFQRKKPSPGIFSVADLVQPQKNPPNQKPPRLPRRRAGCRHSVAACVSDHSRACERIPLRHRSNLQRKKQHRHSGIFRVADLGPGTMPRGKYPESPAPAGSHALISRTPTPGGMLHANLGLPRPPPRNFQPPLPQQLPVQPQKNPPNQKPPRLPRRRAGCRQLCGGMRV